MQEKTDQQQTYQQKLDKIKKLTVTYKDMYYSPDNPLKDKISLNEFNRILTTFYFYMMQSIVMDGKNYTPSKRVGSFGVERYPTRVNDYRRMIYKIHKFNIKYNKKTIRYIVKFIWDRPRSLNLTLFDPSIFRFKPNRTVTRAMAELFHENPSHLLRYHEEQVRKY
jgi:hypothetical protein